jgi:uncharacterized protein
MNTWKISQYTSIINGQNGDILLYNSFMGALACVNKENIKEISRFLNREASSPIHGPSGYKENLFGLSKSVLISEEDLTNPHIKELCNGGFFVPAKIDEKEQIKTIIQTERESNYLHLVIIAHENCNFRCLYCYEKFKNRKINYPLIKSLKAFVSKELSKYNGLIVSWFGGEPLLAKNEIISLSEALIKVCDTLNKTYISNITTNGYLLTPSVFENLIDNKIKHYQVTLDGIAFTHDSLRTIKGQQTHKIILQNLESMSNTNLDFTVNIRVNYNQLVLKYISEFFKEITEKLKGDKRFDVSFHPIMNWSKEKTNENIYCKRNLSKVYKKRLLEEAYKNGFKNGSLKKSFHSHGCVCYAGKESSFVIGTNGTLFKCTVAFNDKINQIGHLKETGRIIIDKQKQNLWVNPKKSITDKCDNCTFFPACQSRTCPFALIKNNILQCPFSKEDYISYLNMITYNMNLN